MPFLTVRSEDPLDPLADPCLAARSIIGERGSAVMDRLIDLLLFEVGVALAGRVGDETATPDRDGNG